MKFRERLKLYKKGDTALTHDELLLFGERLRKRRIALGVTQESVADQVGITLRWYQRIERGENTVSIDTLLALSRVLSVSIDYLMFGELANSLNNPYADIVSKITDKLSPGQRENAIKMLQLFAESCSE